MEIIQFEDKSLAHYSYALISEDEMAIVDPARNPQQYYELAEVKKVKIIAVIETHPHADFVSSHKEIHDTTGATIYVSKLLNADYDHKTFDEGDEVKIGKATLKALNTPGHSPDSICILAINEEGQMEAVFTGDTLFIGDCGRPDLRETAGAITASRSELARMMYHSLRDKLALLPDDVKVYPAHGAGSLCGKGLSSANVSTIGAEKASNWSMQNLTEQEFENQLLADQPFVPKYFTYSVGLNKKGAPAFGDAVNNITISETLPDRLDQYVIIDSRPESEFKNGHLPNAINLMNDTKFETWLGSIISPREKFYLLGTDVQTLRVLIERIAKIGYEGQIAGVFTAGAAGHITEKRLDIPYFRNGLDQFTIVDIRNNPEVKSKPVFKNAIHIPLPELRERAGELPADKPIVVHCAGGYRSAAGASIIKEHLKGQQEVYDLSYAIKDF